jgi:hypothetical protein
MSNSRSYFAIAGLVVGFLLANFLHRPPVDLNMDGAPAVSVPGYSGPVYDAKGKLVAYAQPQIVNIHPQLSKLKEPNKSASEPKLGGNVVGGSVRASHSAALKPMALR